MWYTVSKAFASKSMIYSGNMYIVSIVMSCSTVVTLQSCAFSGTNDLIIALQPTIFTIVLP